MKHIAVINNDFTLFEREKGLMCENGWVVISNDRRIVEMAKGEQRIKLCRVQSFNDARGFDWDEIRHRLSPNGVEIISLSEIEDYINAKIAKNKMPKFRLPTSETVPVPAFDADGYPNEEFITQIENFAVHKVEGGFKLLLDIATSAWHWGDSMYRWDGRLLKISTGGWSGNESLIQALRGNLLFWNQCWVSSRRGGHFEFEIPK